MMSSKSNAKKASSEAFATPPARLGKRKFLESLQESEYCEEMELLVAHRTLSLPYKGYSDSRICQKYNESRHNRATKERGNLDLAYKTLKTSNGSEVIQEHMPIDFRFQASPKKLKKIATDGLLFNINA